MDPSHLSLILLCIHKDDMDEYQCNMHCQIGIQISSLVKLLKCMTKQENGSLYLRYNESENEKELELYCRDKKDEKESNFRLKLFQIDAEKLDIPEQEYDAEMEMVATTFQNLCKDLGSIGDTLEINIVKKDNGNDHSGNDEKKANIEFKVNGEIGSGAITEKMENNIKCKDDFHAKYTIKYLTLFSKAHLLSEKVELHFGKDFPLMLKYGFGSKSYIKFYLAPKLENRE